jgi:hypothetical protein
VHNFCCSWPGQVRDLGKGALLRQEGALMKPGQRDLETWAKSDLDVMEDSQGNTVVKGLTFVEVGGAWAAHRQSYACVMSRQQRIVEVWVSRCPAVSAMGLLW